MRGVAGGAGFCCAATGLLTYTPSAAARSSRTRLTRGFEVMFTPSFFSSPGPGVLRHRRFQGDPAYGGSRLSGRTHCVTRRLDRLECSHTRPARVGQDGSPREAGQRDTETSDAV